MTVIGLSSSVSDITLEVPKPNKTIESIVVCNLIACEFANKGACLHFPIYLKKTKSSPFVQFKHILFHKNNMLQQFKDQNESNSKIH